tara:strand:+ start:113 stop:736 length:624 start_codon:yes stop_codon:yes gene_type:complete
MDYKNFTIRMLVSFIFLTFYLLLILTNFKLVFFLIIAIYFLVLIEVIIYFKNKKLLILGYLILSFISIFNVQFENNYFFHFNLMIFTIIIFDIFSYIVGANIGKIKILKYISPNKTFEGFIGGTLISFSTSFVLLIIFDKNINLFSFLFILIIILSSFIGDVIESFFKRINNIKNSSNFLPGHGGFFDRFDGFIFAIAIYSLMYKLI